jgi:hypothetical protein
VQAKVSKKRLNRDLGESFGQVRLPLPLLLLPPLRRVVSSSPPLPLRAVQVSEAPTKNRRGGALR